MPDNKKQYRYIGALITGTIFFFICAFSNGLFSETNGIEIVRKLTDCFTVAGVILAGAGGLSWASSKGAYDIMKYGVDWVIKPFTSRRNQFESFYDFKQRKAEERKPWLKESFIVGLGFIGVALVLMIIFLVIQ